MPHELTTCPVALTVTTVSAVIGEFLSPLYVSPEKIPKNIFFFNNIKKNYNRQNTYPLNQKCFDPIYGCHDVI